VACTAAVMTVISSVRHRGPFAVINKLT
jgi:hypothetical protein